MPTKNTNWVRQAQSSSDALDLEPGLFQKKSPHAIAQSLLRSVKSSKRKKGSVLSSGISMLNFYQNRAGRNLPAPQKQKIMATKEQYRKLVRGHDGSPHRRSQKNNEKSKRS